MHQHAAVMRFLNKISKHPLGDFEVGDHTVFHRLDRDHVSGCAAEHFLRFAAYGYHFAAVFIDRDDGRLVDYNSFSACKDQCVGGSQVDSQIGREQAEDRPHVVTIFRHVTLPPGSA